MLRRRTAWDLMEWMSQRWSKSFILLVLQEILAIAVHLCRNDCQTEIMFAGQNLHWSVYLPAEFSFNIGHLIVKNRKKKLFWHLFICLFTSFVNCCCTEIPPHFTSDLYYLIYQQIISSVHQLWTLHMFAQYPLTVFKKKGKKSFSLWFSFCTEV